ncbi:MAG: YjbQ family protein [Thermoplasmata archaeon]|nr:YjbQ family protein [Thermoplasmata archaeon]
MEEINIRSSRREELIDITSKIQEVIERNSVENGFVIIYVPHTTAAVTINEGADPDVQRDIINTLHRLIPKNDNYQHLEGNSDAHIKSSILGSSVTVLVKNKKLVLGTWQKIFFYEGDGPRIRKIFVNIFSNGEET